MSKELSNSLTWQKAAVIIAILTIALPTATRFAWQVIFPPNYLLYEITPSIQNNDFISGGITVTNGGNEPQKEVAIYLPSKAFESLEIKVEITSPRHPSLRSFFDATPDTPISKFTHDGAYKIPLGTIDPDQEVRVVMLAKKTDGAPFWYFSIREARVQSSTMTAIEADGLRRPSFHDDIHTTYVELSPYFLAAIAALLALAFLISSIFEFFFDTPRKKMARLWKQMDTLQEQIDKEARYE